MKVSEEESLSSWNNLFRTLDELNAERESQKKKGLNDFTLLGSVLSVNDEVRLHTRFIYALLNPDGKHYQGTRFLELFLNSIGRKDWLDLSSVIVRKEHCPIGHGEQIDLYITDGARQIVIENKLNAKDQKYQVKRYLTAVGATEPAQADDTLFIYLTKGRQRPSNHGLADLSVCKLKGCLLNDQGQPIAQYQNLSYRGGSSTDSIHDWLTACAKEMDENSNLAWAIRDYRSVIERATQEYVSKVKTLKDVLEEGVASGNQYHQYAIQLAKELPAIHASWLDSALTTQLDKLFESAINDGIVTKIDTNNAELLDPYIHTKRRGKAADLLYKPKYNFFKSRKKNKDRGTFYLVTAGAFSHRIVLMMVYGKIMLHVGFLLQESALLSEFQSLDMPELSKVSNSVFPLAMTHAKLLEHQGILHLADFDSSPQKKILSSLLRNLSST